MPLPTKVETTPPATPLNTAIGEIYDEHAVRSAENEIVGVGEISIQRSTPIAPVAAASNRVDVLVAVHLSYAIVTLISNEDVPASIDENSRRIGQRGRKSRLL